MVSKIMIWGKRFYYATKKRLNQSLPSTLSGNLQVRDSDIVLVSYPRSGNTWMRYLLANLLVPEGEWNITNVGRVVPDLLEDTPPDPVQTQPRIVKNHAPFQPEYKRVIYLYRDGRDVAVSYYDFQKKLRNNQDDFPTFLRQMLQGQVAAYGAWQDHVASWLFDDRPVDILPVCYETLCQNTQDELERVADFIGREWQVDEFQMAIAKSSFDKFQQHYEKYKSETHWEKGFTGGVKGGPGKWREVFDQELLDLFWHYAGEVAEKLGYSKV